jgi:hypothetical protein
MSQQLRVGLDADCCAASLDVVENFLKLLAPDAGSGEWRLTVEIQLVAVPLYVITLPFAIREDCALRKFIARGAIRSGQTQPR